MILINGCCDTDSLVWLTIVEFLQGVELPKVLNPWDIVLLCVCALTDALQYWMVGVFTHPVMPTRPEGGGFTASSLPPPHTNLPWIGQNRVSLSFCFSFSLPRPNVLRFPVSLPKLEPHKLCKWRLHTYTLPATWHPWECSRQFVWADGCWFELQTRLDAALFISAAVDQKKVFNG